MLIEIKIMNYKLLLEIFTAILFLISIIFVWKQMRKNHDWNRRKASLEIINEFIWGKYIPIKNKFIEKIGGKNELRNGNYKKFIEKIDKKEIDEVNKIIVEFFNVFEAISVYIIDNTIDEDICYHYLQNIFMEPFSWLFTFLEDRRPDDRNYDFAYEIIYRNWKDRQEKDKGLSTKKILHTKKSKL